MNDGKWVEEVCRAICRKKGIPEADWESQRATVAQVIEAIKESGAVMVPLLGDVT